MNAVGYTGGDPEKVDVSGDTMTGPLVLPGDPSLDLQAATKQYVDSHGGGGGGGIPATTVTSETSFGVTPAVGTGTKYARDDHTHGSPTAPTAASVGAATSGHNHAGTYDPAGSASAALSSALAADPTPGGTVVGETAYGQSSSAGAATTWSRSDHTHGTQALPTAAAIGAAATSHTHAQADITSLVTDLGTKAPLASPTFTGTPTLPTGTVATTQTPGNNTTAVATTAFVAALGALKANLASPTFTGVPAAPTAAAATNTTQLATTAFVTTADNLKANLASPTFTGTPAAPTATQGTNTTQLATTQYVQTEAGLLVPKSLFAAKGTIIAASAANTPAGVAVGSDGTVLTADAASAAGVKWAPAGGGGGTPDSMRAYPKTGWWYRAPTHGPVASNLTMVLNRLYLVPFRVGLAFTADRIGCDIATVGSAGAVVRLGIWQADSTNQLPSTLVLDAGTVQADTGTGSRTITISQALSIGIYWLGIVMQVASGVLLRATVSYDPLLPYFTGANAITGTESAASIITNSVSGALASTPVPTDNDRGPILSLRST